MERNKQKDGQTDMQAARRIQRSDNRSADFPSARSVHFCIAVVRVGQHADAISRRIPRYFVYWNSGNCRALGWRVSCKRRRGSAHTVGVITEQINRMAAAQRVTADAFRIGGIVFAAATVVAGRHRRRRLSHGRPAQFVRPCLQRHSATANDLRHVGQLFVYRCRSGADASFCCCCCCRHRSRFGRRNGAHADVRRVMSCVI